jgi:hypothetical protein
MIYITKNIANRLLFTLNEKRLYTNSSFYLELYSNANKTTQEIFLPNSGDTSNNQYRWNEWEYTEDDELDEGTYDYKVIETQMDTPDKSGNIVETGKLVVLKTKDQIPTFNNDKTEFTFE